MSLFGKSEKELEELNVSLTRELAEELGVLEDFKRYAAEGRFREFVPQLNYLKLKQESKEKLRIERITYLVYGILIGLIAEYFILTYAVGFGYIGGSILAAVFIGALINVFRDVYKVSLKKGHSLSSSILRGSVGFLIPIFGLTSFLLMLFFMGKMRDSLGFFGWILIVILGAVVPTCIVALVMIWIYDKKPKNQMDIPK